MNMLTKRALAATSGALLLAGFATPAMAQGGDDERRGDRGSRPGECSVTLDQRGNSRQIDVEVDASRRAGDSAAVRLEFDRDRRRDVTDWVRIDLDRRGDGDARVRAPRRTDEVTATVYVREGGRRGGLVTCTATLDLDRRGPRS
jgi:hypothetical protein